MSSVEDLSRKFEGTAMGHSRIGMHECPGLASICILEWLEANLQPSPGFLCSQTGGQGFILLLAGKLVDWRDHMRRSPASLCPCMIPTGHSLVLLG